MEQGQTQNLPNLPPNIFIQYTNPQNNGDKNYCKLENIPFQPNTVNINLNQPISIINQPCVINQNNTGFINNQCVTTCAPANYVSLSTTNWNHGMQQVKTDEQMIYQIMYPIIDNTGATMDGQQLAAKQTTVDANVLATGTCTVLTPAKNIPKKHIINSYTIIEKQNQYTNTDAVPIAVIETADQTPRQMLAIEEEDNQEDGNKKKNKKKKQEDENTVHGCHICGEEFKTKGSLRFHMFHHNPKAKNKFQCIGCNEGFEKEKLKQEHELQCERNYKLAQLECCFCDLPCDTPKQLRKHENKHRPIRKTKRYRNTCVCIECKKAFDAIYSLKVHIQKHHKKSHVKPLEDKPFTCSECGLGFRYERSKIKHEFKTHMKQEATTLRQTMDRYIVQNNVGGQTGADQILLLQAPTENKTLTAQNSVVTNNGVPSEAGSTYIIHPSTSKIMDAAAYKLDNGETEYDCKVMETDAQFTAKQLETAQFGEGVGNTAYIIDNNSSNSIDSVRIGNHSFVPVVDSSLYNISVAGSTTQYTIEGVVNPGLGNYIIEAPAYIVEAKPAQTHATHTMYIQQAQEPVPHEPQPPPPPPPPQQQQQQTQQPQQTMLVQQEEDPKKENGKAAGEKKSKKSKEPETGPFFCNICQAEFNSSASLRFHSYHHNPKTKRFSCIGCEKAFERDREKEEHELKCNLNYTNNKFSCIFCDMRFGTPQSLRNHENKHRPLKRTKKYKHLCVCIKCNKAFDAIYTLKVHIKKIHGGNGEKKKKKKNQQQEQEQEQQQQEQQEEPGSEMKFDSDLKFCNFG